MITELCFFLERHVSGVFFPVLTIVYYIKMKKKRHFMYSLCEERKLHTELGLCAPKPSLVLTL